MDLEIRLEKLHFLAGEIRLAFHLARHAPTDAEARMLTRHVVVRAENLIVHARGLRKPLVAAGMDVRAFNRAKEGYAAAFNEYFLEARHRIGAHVQDMDFARRIELWNNIEKVKTDYLVDGSAEIYGLLAAAPQYVPLGEPLERDDAALEEVLAAYRAENGVAGSVELAADPLGQTRPDTLSLRNETPLHARAGQLTLIRRWVTSQRRLASSLAAWPSLSRIIKARLVTDIVSFCDCLTTRAVAAGAAQELVGLDDLLRSDGGVTHAIDGLRRHFDLDKYLVPARAIRDEAGAHLEIDEAVALGDVLARLDAYPLAEALGLYDRLEAAFAETCRGDVRLLPYQADGRAVRNVALPPVSFVPFAGQAAPVSLRMPKRPAYDAASYEEWLTRWATGGPADREAARGYFLDACRHGPGAVPFVKVERFGSSLRNHTHDFRDPHAFLLGRLRDAEDASEVVPVARLLASMSGGDPTALAEVLLRYLRGGAEHGLEAVNWALGELAQWWDEDARAHLAAEVRRPLALRALGARTALIRMFLHTEGVDRFNAPPGARRCESELGWMLESISDVERLLSLLVFASQFVTPRLGIFETVFRIERTWAAAQIRALCSGLLPVDDAAGRADIAGSFLRVGDYPGLCLLTVKDILQDDPEELAPMFLAAVCHGFVACAPHAQALMNRAVCFHEIGERAEALVQAERIARERPDLPAAQLLVVDLLVEDRARHADAVERLDRIVADYRLDDRHLARVEAAREQIATASRGG